MFASQVGFAGSVHQLCTDVPLVNAAWNQIPANQRFPCDVIHLIVIRDYEVFLKSHPEISGNDSLRERGRQAFAFSISFDWPIFVNLDGHGLLLERYNQGGYWIAFAVAGVLAHERVHAMGNPSESAGLLEEFRLDQAFQKRGKLPIDVFDLGKLRRQYANALAEEERLPSRAPAS
jgi:hypothetical protein